ncbi:MAG TPA: DUF1583 domain-containing protein, partial [Pirellulales bacterium]|nr:DUF1583 domain-containing protein [Pirellulales bacterium]
CAASSELNDLGGELLGSMLTYAQRTQDQAMIARMRIDLGEWALRRRGAERQDDVTRRVPWQPAVYLDASAHRSGAARPWWAVDGKQAVHVGGAASDHLIFNYPLTGEFEISADLLDSAWGEANLSFGGLCLDAYAFSQNAYVYPLGRHEQILRKLPSIRSGAFNHYEVRVELGSVQFLINGQTVYREKGPRSSSPWLGLFTNRERRTAFCNVQIKGRPNIPREVQLVVGDRLDGWLANFYSESQPARIYQGAPNDNSGGYYRFGNRSFYDYDWRAAEGILRGGRAPGLAPGAQSRLYYMRPLRDGETLRYEFLYEPEATHVHPALDRLVFLLEPDGVALHWMTDGEADAGLPSDNVAVEPTRRRGPDRLPLKAGEWNAVDLRLAEGEVALKLNGEEVYRRPMEASNDRLFSFFHFKDRTAVQVRNVVLTGDDWPQALSETQLANLLSPIDPKADIDPGRLAETLLGEENVYFSTWQTWQASRSLPAAERYALLRDWVLPDAVRGSVVRLYGEFTPTDPAPTVAESVTAGPPLDAASRRVHRGGDLVAPAFDLVAVAAELGKLDELRSAVEARATLDKFAEQGKMALLTLLAVAAEDDERARQSLAILYPLANNTPKEEAEYRRWPALAAAWAARKRPALRPIAMTMLNQIADASQGTTPRWSSISRHLRARALLASLPDGNVAYSAPLALKQWRAANHATAVSRGNGQPPVHWQHRPGGLMHYAGHEFDYVYFGVPLRGDFELEAELSTFGWREIKAVYAALKFGVLYDHKHYTLSNFERNRPNGPIDPPLDPLGQWFRYRLSVKDGQYTALVNGRQVYSERLPAEPDPWLAIQCWGPYLGEVRQVRITGSPSVPEAINLSAAANLDSWLAEYYGESVSGDEPAWAKRGEEIFGRKLPNAEGVRESLLQYHRPLF